MTVDERLGRIEEKLDSIARVLPDMNSDIESLKEFKWKIMGIVGVLVPIYTTVIALALGKLA